MMMMGRHQYSNALRLRVIGAEAVRLPVLVVHPDGAFVPHAADAAQEELIAGHQQQHWPWPGEDHHPTHRSSALFISWGQAVRFTT